LFNFLLIISFFLQPSFAQQNTVLRDNVAVVAWTGYDDDSFKKIPELTKKLFCSADGAFCVKQDNYITVDMKASFPEGFTEKIKEAVDKIKNQDNPTLIIALSSHGQVGRTSHQTQKGVYDKIYYDKNKGELGLLDVIFENSFSVNKDITLMLFVGACHSGSIIPIAQKKLSCDANEEGCVFEGTDGGFYKYKMSVYASSPSDRTAWDNEFLETLNLVNKLEDCKDKEGCGLNDNGTLTFLSLDYLDDHVFWSSFSGKNEKLLSDGDKNISLKLSDSKDEGLSDQANLATCKATYKKGKESLAATLCCAVKNEADIDVRLRVITTLGGIIHGFKDDEKKMIKEALLYVIKNDKNKEIQEQAILVSVSIRYKNDSFDTWSAMIGNSVSLDMALLIFDRIGPDNSKFKEALIEKLRKGSLYDFCDNATDTKNPIVMKILRDGLKAPDAKDRQEVSNGIYYFYSGFCKSPPLEIIKILTNMVFNDPDAEVRRNAGDAILVEAEDNPAIMKAVNDALKSSDAELKERAIYFYDKIRDLHSTMVRIAVNKALNKYNDKDSKRLVDDQVSYLCKEGPNDPEIIKRLTEKSNDPNPETSKKAKKILNKINAKMRPKPEPPVF
jgi:hypothetical protein